MTKLLGIPVGLGKFLERGREASSWE